MVKWLYGVAVLLCCCVAVLFAPTVHAQGLGAATENLSAAARPAGTESFSDLGTVTGTGIRIIFSLVGTIMLVLMTYAGYLWMTAHGEEEQVTKARKIIVSSTIGFIIVVAAYAITYLIGNRFQQGGRTSSSPSSNNPDKPQPDAGADAGVSCESLQGSCQVICPAGYQRDRNGERQNGEGEGCRGIKKCCVVD